MVGQDAGVTSARTVAWWGAVGVAVLTLLVRLPLVGLPLDPDEGGYGYIARRWAAGERLYSPQAWVDRPQGLLVLFRAVTSVSYSAAAIRVAAVLVAVVLALGVGAVAWALCRPDRRAARGGHRGRARCRLADRGVPAQR